MTPAPNGAAPIVLVGLSGAGKSTVGQLVAARLARRFVDLDEEVEREAGMPVAEIFAKRGEREFRRLEREATANLVGQPDLVLAPGGGWLTNAGAKESLDGGAIVIYLKVSAARAAERLAGSSTCRPLLSGMSPVDALAMLLEQRAEAYAAADFTIDTELLTPQQIAEMISVFAATSPSR